MTKQYKAEYVNGQFQWLGDQPPIQPAPIKLTVIAEDQDLQLPRKRRSPPASIAGKGKTLGDIVSPIVPEEDWECLK